jgi:hypothetical protein
MSARLDCSPDLEIWHQGYAAAQRGASWSANTYPIGSVRNIAWHAGFTQGRAQRFKLKR